jgi:alpha-ribazole phosphatase
MMDLLRHGDTGQTGFRGRLDDPLTPLGWRQMEAAASAGGPWAAVVSSPLRRCADFAADRARRLGLPFAADARLAELDFGRWEGATAAGLMESEPEALTRFWRDPWSNPPPGGEEPLAFEARVLAARRDLEQVHGDQPLLVVTHGGVIRVLLGAARSLPRAQWLAIEVPHASMHRLGSVSSSAPCPSS